MSKHIGSVQDFYEWVKSRDPKETYTYGNCLTCAVARYCQDRGVAYEFKDHVNCTFPHLEPLANYGDHEGFWHRSMGGLRLAIEASGLLN